MAEIGTLGKLFVAYADPFKEDVEWILIGIVKSYRVPRRWSPVEPELLRTATIRAILEPC